MVIKTHENYNVCCISCKYYENISKVEHFIADLAYILDYKYIWHYDLDRNTYNLSLIGPATNILRLRNILKNNFDIEEIDLA